MSRPVAGVAIASRCVLVIRGVSIPFVVLLISSADEEAGAVVPMPALPVTGNVFCALEINESSRIHPMATKIVISVPGRLKVEFVSNSFFIFLEFLVLRIFVGGKDVLMRTCDATHERVKRGIGGIGELGN